MSDLADVKKLRDEFEEFKKRTKSELDAQDKVIRKLKIDMAKYEKEQSQLKIYVNNLIKKAELFFKRNFENMRRTQVIDRQKINSLDDEVSYLSRRIRK